MQKTKQKMHSFIDFQLYIFIHYTDKSDMFTNYYIFHYRAAVWINIVD